MGRFKTQWLKWSKRLGLGLLGLVLVLIVYSLLQLIDPVPIAPISQSAQLRFDGRALLVASDADMVASAYLDGFPNKVAGIEDTLTVIDLPINPTNPKVTSVPVSNSVTAWPQVITTSPNGNRAYVVELRGKLPKTLEQLNPAVSGLGLPEGTQLTTLDIADPNRPNVIESLSIGRIPAHISMSPNGKFLAITLDGEQDRELLIIPVNDGKLGQKYYFNFKHLMGDPVKHVNSVSWHPSSRFLALNLDNRSVGFYQLISNLDKLELNSYGQPVSIGNTLSIGQFTPDGRHYLISEVNWGAWEQLRSALTFIPGLINFFANPKGQLVSIYFNADLTQVIQPQVVSQAYVGLSPEGWTLSPDGLLAVTVNMRRTYIPTNWLPWRGKHHSSLSLVKVNPQSGELTTIGQEYGFEGILPEKATFDAQGKSLAVVIFNYRENTVRKGAVEFWNVIQGNEPKLERTRFKINVVRGAHDITLVR